MSKGTPSQVESLTNEGSFYESLKSQSKVELQESFEIMTGNQIELFWFLAEKQCISAMTRVDKLAYDDSQDMNPELSLLMKIVVCAELTIKNCKSPPLSMEKSISKIASLLLFPGTPLIREMKITVARFIESWWSDNNSSAINSMVFLVPYLLMECLKPGVKAADFKRLWNIRGGFLLLDYQNESTLLIRELILDALMCSSFSNSNIGEKLLVFFLVLDKGFFLATGLKMILQVIVKTNLTFASAYGKIFHSVWKELITSDANAPSVIKIEEALQTWVYQAVHASNARYFAALRSLIQSFHATHRNGALHSMLKRVYGPILWRSVKCANAIVRAHATVLFFDVFPLHDPDGSAEEDDTLLQKQFDLLTALLNDSDHTVRLNAVNGACQILIDYWEALPHETTNNILRHLILKLATDSSSPSVRASVFTCLEKLLKAQPLSHNVLKTLIPMTKNSLHDSAEKVRVAFLKLLIQVSGIKSMHFYEVCELDAILDQMVVDQNSPIPCYLFTQLLQNSFFPSGSPAQLSRCMKFLEMNESAAMVFYANLPRVVDNIGRVVKFTAVLSTIILDKGPSIISDKKASKSKRARQEQQQDVLEETPLANVDEDSKHSLRFVVLMLLSNLRNIPVEEITEDSIALLTKYFTAEKLYQLIVSSAESEHETDCEVALQIVNSLFSVLEQHNINLKTVFSELVKFDCVALLNNFKQQLVDEGNVVLGPKLGSLVAVIMQFGQNDVLLKWLVKEFKIIKQAVEKKQLNLTPTVKIVVEVFTVMMTLLISQKKLALLNLSSFNEIVSVCQYLMMAYISGSKTIELDMFDSALLALSTCCNVSTQLSVDGSYNMLDWMQSALTSILKPSKSLKNEDIGLFNLCFYFLSDLFYVSSGPAKVCEVASKWLELTAVFLTSYCHSQSKDAMLFVVSGVGASICKVANLLAAFSPSELEFGTLRTALMDSLDSAGLDNSSPVFNDVMKSVGVIEKNCGVVVN